MPTIAYLRVSTGGQDLVQQKLAVLDYAHKHRLTVDTFLETHQSAQRAGHQEELLQLIATLQPGDQLIVSELSRLGRSLGQILHIVDGVIRQGVRLVANDLPRSKLRGINPPLAYQHSPPVWRGGGSMHPAENRR